MGVRYRQKGWRVIMIDIEDELKYLYGLCHARPEVYLMEQLMSPRKDYNSEDVWEWIETSAAATGARKWGKKLDDLLMVRVLEHPLLDKALKVRYLECRRGWVARSKVEMTGQVSLVKLIEESYKIAAPSVRVTELRDDEVEYE